MFQLIKRSIRYAAWRFGYEILPIGSTGLQHSVKFDAPGDFDASEKMRQLLGHCQAMRTIHSHDSVEIEELYRQFVFADLPRRDGRAELLNNLIGTTVSEAIYIISYLHQALLVPGAICEFGVAQGATSRLIAAEIMETDRELWLFDSFEGLPEPSPEDKLIHDIFNLGSMRRYKGTMASPETEVRDKLAEIGFPPERTMIRKGWIEDTLRDSNIPNQVCFAYVDFDFYAPIKEALAFLDRTMPAGGRIIVDDYGFFSEGAQRAVDEFLKATAGRFEFHKPLPSAGNLCVLKKVS
jgi:O-methyltransferase